MSVTTLTSDCVGVSVLAWEIPPTMRVCACVCGVPVLRHVVLIPVITFASLCSCICGAASRVSLKRRHSSIYMYSVLAYRVVSDS